MDFTFTNDELAFRAAVGRFLMTEAAPELLRDIGEASTGRWDELRSKIVSQGVTALSVPENYGGLGQDDVAWSLINHELGYYAIPDSLVDTAYIGAGLIAALDAARPERDAWLPRIADGSIRIAVGHPINLLVAEADAAEILLLAHDDEVHAVPRERVNVTASPGVDPTRGLARVNWTPAPDTCLAQGAAGRSLWDVALERGALAIAGQLVGLAQRMLDLSVDYVAQRKQFGKPIGSFQSVKHHLADVATQIEFCKPVLYRAAHAVARGDRNASVRVSHARLVCGQAAWLAARHGIQVHGAMGYTWEVDLQMFMKRVWGFEACWGDQGFHKSRVEAFVLGDGAALGPGLTF